MFTGELLPFSGEPVFDDTLFQSDCSWSIVYCWLFVSDKVDFQILLLVYKALNGFGYISDLLLCHEPSRPLRSSGTSLLWVPKIKTKHREASFSYYAPPFWNKLSEHCRSSPYLSSFKSRLKTFLGTAFLRLWTALWHLFSSLVSFKPFLLVHYSIS